MAGDGGLGAAAGPPLAVVCTAVGSAEAVAGTRGSSALKCWYAISAAATVSPPSPAVNASVPNPSRAGAPAGTR